MSINTAPSSVLPTLTTYFLTIALPVEIVETNLTARANLVPCYGYYLDGNNYGTLWATCPKDHYVDGLTYLDLNKCLINNFGKLEWQNGG